MAHLRTVDGGNPAAAPRRPEPAAPAAPRRADTERPGALGSSGSVDEWTAAVAHELTTVQSSIGGFAELMADGELEDDHEMGLALAATVLMEARFPVTYLGRDLPVAGIVSAVCLTSVAMASQRVSLARLVAACSQRGVAVVFGGQGVDGPIAGLPATYLGSGVSGLPEKLAGLA